VAVEGGAVRGVVHTILNHTDANLWGPTVLIRPKVNQRKVSLLLSSEICWRCFLLIKEQSLYVGDLGGSRRCGLVHRRKIHPLTNRLALLRLTFNINTRHFLFLRASRGELEIPRRNTPLSSNQTFD
jgi:hypothetical protein